MDLDLVWPSLLRMRTYRRICNFRHYRCVQTVTNFYQGYIIVLYLLANAVLYAYWYLRDKILSGISNMYIDRTMSVQIVD